MMPSNHSSPVVHYWAGRYPKSVAWLMGPKGYGKTKLREWLPYALDNDVYGAWSENREWDADGYFNGLDSIRLNRQQPMWAAVPDSVGDRDKTLAMWEQYSDRVGEYGWPLAFVVQDGMTLDDIPERAEIVFVGGTTTWKWRHLNMWMESGKRVHVGRVNSLQRVWLCHDLGIESVDGTGWFRDGDDANRLLKLESYFKRERLAQTMELFGNEN